MSSNFIKKESYSFTNTNINNKINSNIKKFTSNSINNNGTVKTSFYGENAYFDGNNKSGKFLKKKMNDSNIQTGNLSNSHLNKLFNNVIKLPGSLPILTNSTEDLSNMGYTYQRDIPNENNFAKNINQTDPYYTDFFLKRGGNNK